ncbi:ribosomal RNA-processing protein [Trifolium repens]|nr:ribosomal RNA-processing protein [Trifolium repens]
MEEDSAILERKTGHVKKRALKNKALGITFDEKDLKDFVTGFHKRKKKRRKVAQKQQEDAKRRKRNEERLKRKLERELAYGGVPQTDDTEAATKTYENDDLKVTVVTKEINPEEESFPSERKEAAPGVSPHPIVADKKKSVPINKKKPFKKVAKNKSQPKQRSKRDKRKGKKPGRK